VILALLTFLSPVGTGLVWAASPAAGGLAIESGGHIKSFNIAAFPSEDSPFGTSAFGQGVLAGRLQLAADLGDLHLELHPQANLGVGGAAMAIATGVEAAAPEALDLSWSETQGEVTRSAKLDRASIRHRAGSLRTTLGRQAFSHGQGRLFTPMDLIAPFTPATLDTEFKPGIDAARVEAFFGTASKLEVVAAHLGEWDMAHTALILTGQTTVLTTDLGLYAATLHDDTVLGASAYSPIGPVGIYGDATITLTDGEAAHRVVIGTDLHPLPDTRVGLELYSQGFGADEPGGYLSAYADPRTARGELWLVGHNYAGLTLAQSLSPLINLAGFSLVNLDDGSAMVSASLGWSAAENADLSMGFMAGLGETSATTLASEFGAMPLIFHAQSGLFF